MKNFIFFLFVSIFADCQSIIPISKKDFDNHQFDNLHFLKADLENVRLIGLGESTHYAGAAYSAKVKMIKYLHENCGFNVIAFEAPLFNLTATYDSISNGSCSIEDARKKNSIVWYTEELKELYEYIFETQKTENPLILTGFDNHVYFNKETKDNDLIIPYFEFIDRLNTDTNSNISKDTVFRNSLKNAYANRPYYTKLTPSDTLILYNKIQEINNALLKLDNAQLCSYYQYWRQITKNIPSVYQNNYKDARDKQMADNISYLANVKYPDEKIILWAASWHLLPNPELIRLKKDKKYTHTGKFIKDEFDDQYYFMAYIPFQGEVGFKGYLGLGKRRIKSKKGNLEKYINDNCNCEYAFINANNSDFLKIVEENEIKSSNVIGTSQELMDVTNVADSYFYIKNEHIVDYQ